MFRTKIDKMKLIQTSKMAHLDRIMVSLMKAHCIMFLYMYLIFQNYAMSCTLQIKSIFLI